MSFSSAFLGALVYGALVWCAVAAIGLGAALIRDLANGDVW